MCTTHAVHYSLMWNVLDIVHRGIVMLADLVAPPRMRTKRLRDRRAEDLVITPRTHDLCGNSVVTLLTYHEETAEDAIRALKYDGNQQAAALLAHALAEYLDTELAGIRAYSPRRVVLVPVPLHESRERERGYNQIERVLEKLPQEFRDGTRACIESRALVRTRATPQQTRLHRRARLRNVADAFAGDSRTLSRAHAIIVDDVVTTGATLSECARVARAHGARVSTIALARA